MTIANRSPVVRVRIDQVVAARRDHCPDRLQHLQDRPTDLDDAVAVLRWSVAWRMVDAPVEVIARESGVALGRIVAFMEAPARRAGDLLTFAEAASLMRVVEVRVEDRELVGELDDLSLIARPYLEAAGLDYGRALRRARQVRRAYRAANPSAATYSRG
jgi:hypothetical protein